MSPRTQSGQELKLSNTYYILVTVGQLIDHLKSTCGGCHALYVLTLQNDMKRYHLESEIIPEYINEIEDAQAKAERANNRITDTMLVIIATNTMLSTEKLPRTNKGWE